MLREYYTAIGSTDINQYDQETELTQKGKRWAGKMDRGHGFDKLYVRHGEGNGDANDGEKS